MSDLSGSETTLGEWADRAACKGKPADWWFPESGQDLSFAKAICKGCPVQTDCLTFALDNREKIGIWGGLSERERRRIRRNASGGYRSTPHLRGDALAAAIEALDVNGRTGRSIAAELGIHEATVYHHRNQRKATPE